MGLADLILNSLLPHFWLMFCGFDIFWDMKNIYTLLHKCRFSLFDSTLHFFAYFLFSVILHSRQKFVFLLSYNLYIYFCVYVCVSRARVRVLKSCSTACIPDWLLYIFCLLLTYSGFLSVLHIKYRVFFSLIT